MEFAIYAKADTSGYSCSAIIRYKGNSLKGLTQVGSQSDIPEELGKKNLCDTKGNSE